MCSPTQKKKNGQLIHALREVALLSYKLVIEFRAMKSLVSIVHEMLLLSVAAKSDNHVDILLQLIRTSGPRSDEISIR